MDGNNGLGDGPVPFFDIRQRVTVFGMLPWEYLPSLVLVLSLGIFVQASAGFAAGLLIVPLLLWTGHWGIPEAQTALLVATIPQNLSGVWAFREHLSAREVAFPGALRILALPLGAVLLFKMEELPQMMLRQIVGAVVVVLTLLIIIVRPRPRKKLPIGWSLLAFLSSGFFQGIVGMGGPMMVFWVQAHDWETQKSRGFLFSMYLISIIPALGLLWWLFPGRVFPAALTTLLLVPWLLLVTWAGLRVGTWLGRKRLKVVTLGLLLLIGTAGIASPWLSGSAEAEPSELIEAASPNAVE